MCYTILYYIVLCCIIAALPVVLPRHSLPVCKRGERGWAERSLGPWPALGLKFWLGPRVGPYSLFSGLGSLKTSFEQE